MKKISWTDFTKVELRVGKIISAEAFPEAHKPSYRLVIDFGDKIGTKKSSAQITDLYTTDDLLERLVVAVINFPPKQIGPLLSECLVTGFYNNKGQVVLCTPDKEVPLGTKLL